MTSHDVIIIGAGAAGLMCAIEAGKRGRSVLLLERSEKPAQKIRISGGGRCNFTNLDVRPGHFLSQNPHFCKSALKRYGPADFIALIEAHHIAYHEKTLGQLFCDGSAQAIITMLLDECRRVSAAIITDTQIETLARSGGRFELATNHGSFSADSLVVATGGPSIPKMGATGYGYEIARQFGLNIIPPQAALVPFTLPDALLDKVKALAGVAADVEVSCGAMSFREAMLFTHRGVSGPAMLQISTYWQSGAPLSIDFAPGHDIFAKLTQARTATPARSAAHMLAEFLPKRLARFLCDEANIEGRMADISNVKFRRLSDMVQNWTIHPNGTEGMRSAEVTSGGLDTKELSSKTFEAKSQSGLYFIGEVIDVTGQLGGFNFQWAWASGHAAGQYV